jgi:hypothetical protein
VKILAIVNRGVKGTKRSSSATVTVPKSKASASAGAISAAPSATSGEPTTDTPMPESQVSSGTSSDSSSSSSSGKKSKKKSKKHSKSKKQAKKDKKAAHKKAKKDKKAAAAVIEESVPEKKARRALEKAQGQALLTLQSCKKKHAEQMIGKLAPALAGITSSVNKDTFCFVPDMIKEPMMEAFAELEAISTAACLLVQTEGKSDEDIPDLQAGISHISQSIERVIANTLSSGPSLHIGQRAIATQTCGLSHIVLTRYVMLSTFSDRRPAFHTDHRPSSESSLTHCPASHRYTLASESSLHRHSVDHLLLTRYVCAVASSCPSYVIA